MPRNDSPKVPKKKILILGAGFGGLSAALEFAARYDTVKTPIDITLIDRNPFQLFTPDLYEIASATNHIKSEEQLRNTVCLNVRAALHKEHIRFVQANIKKIDTNTRTVTTTKGKHTYDYLLIALGSQPYYFGIPGMQKHSTAFKWIDDAVNIRSTIDSLLTTQKTARVLICGAGPAGVEVAAELIKSYNTRHAAPLQITIVEAKKQLLTMLPKKAQRIARRRLQHLGIKIKTNWTIATATKGKVTSTTGQVLTADYIIWTGGVKASDLLQTSGLTLTPRGQAPVHPTTQSQQHPEVFVVGDAAELKVSKTEYSPQTAHEAVHQGPVAARNILNLIADKELKSYQMRNEGFVVTLGGKYGIVVLPGNTVISGPIAWFIRKYVDFRHFRSVLPFMQACKTWYRAFKIMNSND